MNIVANNGVIYAGHQLDNLATVISFPVGDIISDAGEGGTWAVRIQRNGDAAAYPTSNFAVSGNELNLTLTASDLAKVGEGQIQLKYTVGTKVLMSRVYHFNSLVSLDASETVPEPWVSWVDEVEANADRAEEAVEHYPYIDSTTHHWMRWDVENEEFVDTGISAQGVSDFEELDNRPKYNGTVMTGDTNIPDAKAFVATYGTTTASEIAAAITAGKAIFVKYDDGGGVSHQLMLVDESNSKYGFAESTVGTSGDITSVAGMTITLNKQDNVWEVFTGSGSIPTKTSDLENDSGFLTEHQSLANYYTKTQTDDLLDDKVNTTENSLTTESKLVVGAINEVNSGKVDKVSGKGLSTEDYTSEEKTKLSGIESGADVTDADNVKSSINGSSYSDAEKKVLCNKLGAEFADTYELIETITLSAATTEVSRNQDTSGNAYDFSSVLVVIKRNGSGSASGGDVIRINNIVAAFPTFGAGLSYATYCKVKADVVGGKLVISSGESYQYDGMRGTAEYVYDGNLFPSLSAITNLKFTSNQGFPSGTIFEIYAIRN